jgi:hypothetical protein
MRRVMRRFGYANFYSQKTLRNYLAFLFICFLLEYSIQLRSSREIVRTPPSPVLCINSCGVLLRIKQNRRIEQHSDGITARQWLPGKESKDYQG